MRRSIPRKKAWRLCSFRYFLPLVSFWLPVSCMPRLNQIKIEMLPTYLTYSPQRARRSGATVPRRRRQWQLPNFLWSLPADASCPALVMEVIHHYPENSHRNHTNLLTILQDTRLVRESPAPWRSARRCGPTRYYRAYIDLVDMALVGACG